MKDVTQPVRARGTMLSAVALVAALAALLALAPFASAASDPLASGTTTLTLNKNLLKKLKKSGVKVIKVSPATLKVRTVTLPVSGGSLDPTNGQGTVEQSGGIKFKHGKKSAVVKELVLETTTSSLKAKVAGKKMKLASVSGVSSARNGFGANVTIGSTKLTGKAAKQLNKKLGFTGKQKKKAPFKGGKGLGSGLSETQPKTVTVLATGKATLTPNAVTLGKFASKGVNPLTDIKPINGAEVVAGPAFAFPISGGSLSPTASAGTLQTSGGLAIEPGAGLKTEFNNLFADFGTKVVTAEINITPSPPGPGDLKRSSIADIDMSTGTVSSDPSARTITVTGVTAKLQEVAATTLNTVYPGGVDFVPGDPLGTFSFTAQTQ
jgi:hypothetical protein